MGTLQLHPVSFTLSEFRSVNGSTNGRWDWFHARKRLEIFTLRACSGSVSSNEDNGVRNEPSKTKNDLMNPNLRHPFRRLQVSVSSLPPVVFLMRRHNGTNIAIGMSIATTILFIIMRLYAARRSRYGRPGSVADLVRRGQLRSDRRGISRPLKYDDPFNNPLVKVSKGNSTVEMCGKLYRLAPVTLTEEQQTIHQKRRSRAYQWKRPKVFLKEGDSIPPDVDPDTVRWIPANHPFATTASEIDEGLAQNNVYQKDGVPYRIQAEHEAMQRKLELLQNEQNLNNLLTDPINGSRDSERQLKSFPKSSEVDNVASGSQVEHPSFDPTASAIETHPSSGEKKKQ